MTCGCGRSIFKKPGRGRPPTKCETCRGHDKYYNKSRQLPEMCVSVDCESGRPDNSLYNEMLTFSYGRADGTAGSIKAKPGEILDMRRDVLPFLFRELHGPYKGADGKTYKQVLTAFHFDHDTALLLKPFTDGLQLVHKAQAKEVGLLCDLSHKDDEPECIKFHRRNQTDCQKIMTDGGEGSLLAWDPQSKFAFATTPGRRFYVEHRPEGDRYESWRRLDIHDVGSSFPGSLERNLDIWRPKLRDGDREIIAWGKAIRKDNLFHEDRDKTALYSEAECVALSIMINDFLDAVRQGAHIEMRVSQLYGSGSVAGAALKHYGVTTREKTHEEGLRKVGGMMLEMIPHLTYYGGKIEAPVIGRLTQIVNSRDINSAYPSQMVNLPCMEINHGEWLTEKGACPVPDGAIGYVMVSWAHPEGATQNGPFMVRDKLCSVYSPRVGRRVWITMAEYQTALKYWGEDWITVHHTIWWKPLCACESPLAWLAEVYDKRQAIKKSMKLMERNSPDYLQADAIANALKLIINSVYGKLAQREPTMGVYTNLHWASHITGATRAQLNAEIWDVERDGGSVVYNHTDSVSYIGQYREDQGDALGAWGAEDPKLGLVIQQPGLAAPLGGGKAATRGVSKGVYIKALTELVDTEGDAGMFRQHPTTWTPLEVSDVRMFTRRYALALGKPQLAGSFLPHHMKIGWISGKRNYADAVPLGDDNPEAWKIPPKEYIHPDDMAKLEHLSSYRNELRRQRLAGVYDTTPLDK